MGGGHENPYIEILRMQQLGDNVHILKCTEALEDDDFLYIITPWCTEGSLKENIPWAFLDSECPGFSTEDARKFFQQILECLCYLERHGICHHDISPDNFMFYNDRLLLADFAMSLRIPKDKYTNQRSLIHPPRDERDKFGTFAYQAPEVFFS